MSLLKLLSLALVTGTSATAAFVYYGQQEHRPFRKSDIGYLRDLDTGGRLLGPNLNPGLRAEKDFVSEKEETELIEELKEVIKQYGIVHDPQNFHVHQMAMDYLPHPPPVNTMRVTGRYESPIQRLAPWGYGDDFKIENVPPQLRKTLDKITSSSYYSLGSPRDITINYRHSGYFRLDPHVDPLNDGPDVFILGLKSPTVLTLGPTGEYISDLEVVAKESWTAEDIDMLVPRRTLVNLSGDARYYRHHSIRPGVQKEGDKAMYDWWGSPYTLIKREDERFSVVFAFGHANPVLALIHNVKDFFIEKKPVVAMAVPEKGVNNY